jgi:hypothetical protein
VGEAVDAGVVKNSLASLVASHTRVASRRILDATLGMMPVMRVADEYLSQGDRYAYEQLFLLAPLCLARKIPLPWPVKKAVRAILDHAAAALEVVFNAGKQPMICSEFVYRCYDEADAAAHDPYDIEIDSSPAAALTASVLASRAPRGRGIHPNSVLAAVLRTQPQMPSSEFTREAVPKATPVDLETSLRDYVDGVRRHKESASRADLIVDGDLVRSVHRFAIALARAVCRPIRCPAEPDTDRRRLRDARRSGPNAEPERRWRSQGPLTPAWTTDVARGDYGLSACGDSPRRIRRRASSASRTRPCRGGSACRGVEEEPTSNVAPELCIGDRRHQIGARGTPLL